MSETTRFVTQAPQGPQGQGETADAEAFAVAAARLMADFNCEDVLVFDVRGLSEVTHFVVIGTGTSDTQMRSVASDIGVLGKENDFQRYGGERDDASTWIVADFVEVVCHLFEPGTRAHYDLEMMWGDAPKLKWRRDPNPPGAEPREAEPSDANPSDAN